MHLYYCKACKADSMTPVCSHCGAEIGALNQIKCFKWYVNRMPLGDTPTLMGAFKVWGLTVVVLLLFLFLGELIFSPDKQAAVTMLSASGVLPWAFVAVAVGAAMIMLWLGLQGVEERHYLLDSRGVRMQVWIEPSRIKCWTRFISYDTYRIRVVDEQKEKKRMLISETYLLWPDVCRYEIRRHAGRIDLYRPSGFRFMSLYPEMEEMEELLAYLAARMKHLPKK